MDDDLKHLFKENFLHYASYVIRERAIPNWVDGLKPVQRRILWTLHKMDDGKLHKVANVAGQTMAYHPHGDAPIIEALVNLATKGFLLDTQGNFGNPNTGDPPAAARYIETRLGALAKETLFNSDITTFIPSYDGRSSEPIAFPAKIPLLLMQGAEGIAVGMATKILPHNFRELLEAEIAILEGKPFDVLPDFPTGGIMDASEYHQGHGKVKLRARINIVDDKTLVINEICFGTTTESLIRSIDDAAKKGKIKIDSIDDYTAEKIEIEIKLPRGQYAQKVVEALYAFTECQITIHGQFLVIKDKLPWECTTHEFLKQHVLLLKGYLQQELEIEQNRLREKIFEKTLEQIFVENRLYKKIEEVTSYPLVHATIEKSLKPFHPKLARIPTEKDREKLLSIPIRRISRFDIDKNRQEIRDAEKELADIERQLKNIKLYTIKYLRNLLNRYGDLFPRKTTIQAIEDLNKKEIEKRSVRVGYDAQTGFVGTKVAGPATLECLNLDKLLILYKDGVYKTINIPEKLYLHANDSSVVWIGTADKKTDISVVYRDVKTGYPYVKRFIIKQFILDKEYRFLDPEHKLELISSQPNVRVEVQFKSKPRQKVTHLVFDLDETPIKGVSAKGIRVANKEMKSLKIIKRKGNE